MKFKERILHPVGTPSFEMKTKRSKEVEPLQVKGWSAQEIDLSFIYSKGSEERIIELSLTLDEVMDILDDFKRALEDMKGMQNESRDQV